MLVSLCVRKALLKIKFCNFRTGFSLRWWAPRSWLRPRRGHLPGSSRGRLWRTSWRWPQVFPSSAARTLQPVGRRWPPRPESSHQGLYRLQIKPRTQLLRLQRQRFISTECGGFSWPLRPTRPLSSYFSVPRLASNAPSPMYRLRASARLITFPPPGPGSSSEATWKIFPTTCWLEQSTPRMTRLTRSRTTSPVNTEEFQRLAFSDYFLWNG